MNTSAMSVRVERQDAHGQILLPAWNSLDDTALLAHFRAPRDVHFDPVIDPEEIRAERIDGIMHGRFEFNGETHVLSEPLNWINNPSKDIEWHILLHKFYYATGLSQAWQTSGDARYARRWAQLVDGWISARIQPGFIAADVTGRRVQNWIYSLHGLVMHGRPDRHAPVDHALFRRLIVSLHEQVEFLCENLTAKRNHRTLELLAILLAAVVFPEFRRAREWREFALTEMVANIQADLLPDGVHCELSTDYHHLALRNWLQARKLITDNGIAVPPSMDQGLRRALEFSLHIHKPDGIVPSFSDGDARSFLPLLQQGAEIFGREDMRFVANAGRAGTAPAQRVAHFPFGGYHVIRSHWRASPDFADAHHLVFDCGPLGEGNHGHFDALSIELAACGRSLIVDPGRYTYSEAAGEDGVNWRVHFRSTAAHNTVCVDGRQQTRYVPKAIKEPSRHTQGSTRHKVAGPAPDTSFTERFHGGYLDVLRGRCASHEYDAVHERTIVFAGREYWIVSDRLRADSVHDYTLSFQLAPHTENETSVDVRDGLVLRSPGLLLAQPACKDMKHGLCEGWVSARYGHKQPAPVLKSAICARDAAFDTVLLPWRNREPVLEVTRLTLEGGATALRIVAEIDGTAFIDTWFMGEAENLWIGACTFSGRWLYMREGGDTGSGMIVTHAGAMVSDAGSATVVIGDASC